MKKMMTKAEEIMAQDASDRQKRRWAEGNAIEREFRGNSGYWAEFLYEDGSMICCAGSKPSVYA